MDIHNFFGSSFSKSATSSLREGSESEEDSTNEAPPSKKPCAYHHLLQPLGNTTRSGQKIFHGQNMMATSKVHFEKYAERLKLGVSLHKEVEVCGSQNLSRIGKRQFKS